MPSTPIDDPEPMPGENDPGSRAGRGGWALALALTPVLLIVGLVPGFITQDGPAHLYNAEILRASLGSESPFAGAFAVRWAPLPNWAGHLLLMGLLSILSPRWSDVAATSIPLMALASAAFFLRKRVADDPDEVAPALLCALIAVNVCWLLGFTGFLLGACLFPITLGVWWEGRNRMTPARVAALAGLIVVGYFGHLVSLGLTIVGLIVLSLATPGLSWRRLLGTLAAISPMIVLGPIYRGIMRQGGPVEPIWGHLQDVRSLASWRQQLGWVDPISLGRKLIFPGVRGESPWFGLVSPVVLMIAALVLFAGITWKRRDPERRGWLILGGVLLLGGFVTPDTLGPTHGNYLPQRVVLLGLVAILPWFRFARSSFAERVVSGVGIALLVAAMAIQTLTVWAYARESRAVASPFLSAARRIGHRPRVGTLLVDLKGAFRANPRLHADNLVGIEAECVVWANYETTHYYFPVQFRADVKRPEAGEFEAIALRDHPSDATDRALRWLRLLSEHHREIDVLLVWGTDPTLEAITSRWFDPAPLFEDGPLRALRHR